MDIGFRQRAAGLSRSWQHLLAQRHSRWLERRVPSQADVQLRQKFIFILPTGQGALFGLAALLVLGLAIAERNPVSLLLSVLMLSLFLVNLLLSYRNLSGLRLRGQSTDPEQPTCRCFAGGVANFTLTVEAAGRRRTHRDLLLGFYPTELQALTVPNGTSIAVTLKTPAGERGLMAPPRLILRTRYPAGLWQAWSRPDLAMSCLVYPQPQICALPAMAVRAQTDVYGQQSASRQSGVDDFMGLRSYQSGDSRRRIAWHSLARGQGLQTKQFVPEAEPPIMLSFAHFPGLETEAVLSCLCFQVLQLSRRGRAVGLQLPGGVHINPGLGETHKHDLLRALAQWT